MDLADSRERETTSAPQTASVRVEPPRASPFDGITHERRVAQVRELHADLSELAHTKQRLHGAERARLRDGRELLATYLASLGYRRYEDFLAAETRNEVRGVDDRDTTKEDSRSRRSKKRATKPRRQPRRRQSRSDHDGAGDASRTHVESQRASPSATSRDGAANGTDESGAALARTVDPGQTAPDGDHRTRDTITTAERAPRRAPQEAGVRFSDWIAPASEGYPIANAHAAARRDVDEFDALRSDLTVLLHDVSQTLRAATVEVRTMSRTLREARDDLDTETRRLVRTEEPTPAEDAQAAEVVARLETVVAATRTEALAAPVPDDDVLSSTAHTHEELRPRRDSEVFDVLAALFDSPSEAAATASDDDVVAATTGSAIDVPAPLDEIAHRRERVRARNGSRRLPRRVMATVAVILLPVAVVGAFAYANRDPKPSFGAPADAKRHQSPAVAVSPVSNRPTTTRGTVSSRTTTSLARRAKVAAASPVKTPPTTTAEDAAIANAYVTAYRAECQALWSHAGGDGLLWDPTNLDAGGHVISECMSSVSASDGAVFSSTSDASVGGKAAADSWATDQTVSNQLAPTHGSAFDIPA